MIINTYVNHSIAFMRNPSAIASGTGSIQTRTTIPCDNVPSGEFVQSYARSLTPNSMFVKSTVLCD